MPSLTVAITNYNYGRFIRQAIESALELADEVIVYDDASTDDSWDIIREYPVDKAIRCLDNHGGPVWGYNAAIKAAKGDYITFLDSDNYLINRPRLSGDYCFASIDRIDEFGNPIDGWDYGGWPLTARECLERFSSTRAQPLPSGGFWRCDFLREQNLSLITFEGVGDWAYDIRTHIEWLQHDPELVRLPYPSLVLRWHDAQITQDTAREAAAFNEIRELARSL